MPEASLDLLAGEMDEVSYPRGTRILKAGSSGYHLQSDDGELGELIDRHIESGTDKEEYARFCEQAAMSFGFGN
ncbi:uncharacterized protein BN796_01588 [Alistipes sp. CAG:831]|nr:uncharacterized protein BN796_01588 [Alistipes sp. CAG:831]